MRALLQAKPPHFGLAKFCCQGAVYVELNVKAYGIQGVVTRNDQLGLVFCVAA